MFSPPPHPHTHVQDIQSVNDKERKIQYSLLSSHVFYTTLSVLLYLVHASSGKKKSFLLFCR